MKRIFLILTLLILITLELIGQEIPKQISYQGILKDATGNLLTGDFALTFKIYNEPTGGTPLWTEIQVLSVNNGLFNSQLGSVTPIANVTFDRLHFLGITVGTGTELTPRTMLTPAPYTFMSMNVMDETITTTKLQDGAVTGVKIASNAVVKSLNGIKDDVTLLAGTNITLTPSGNNITIDAGDGGGGSVTQVNTGAGLTGGPITTTGTISIPDDAITSAMLKSNTVTSAKIVDATITGTDIANSTIGPEKLNFTPGTGTVTNVATGSGLTGGPVTTTGTISIASSGVTSTMILDGTIATGDLSDNSVTSAKIVDGTVTTSDILDLTVGTTDLANNSVTTGKIVDATITGTDIANNTIGPGKLNFTPGTGTVTSIATGSGLTGGPVTTTGTISVDNAGITSAMLQSNSVTSAKITDGTIVTADLGDNSVNSVKIGDGSILNEDINSTAAIVASKIFGDAGIEYNSIGTVSGISTTATSLGSIIMSCPAAGYVLLMLSGDAIFFGDNTVVEVGLSTSSSAINLNYARTGRLDGTGTLRYVNDFTAIDIYPVNSGQYIFFGVALKEGVFSANAVNLINLRLTGVFIPKKY